MADSGRVVKKKHKGPEQTGNTTLNEATDAVNASEEVSQENNDAGAEGSEYEKTDEEVSGEIAAERAQQEADRSPASVAPTREQYLMGDTGTVLTPGQEANLDEDDPRHPDAPEPEALPNATPIERSSLLPVNSDATKDYGVEAAAKRVGVKTGEVINFTVRGDETTGQFLTVVDHNGKKHSVKL